MQTITKVFETYKQARNAVDALVAAGIPMLEISVLANREIGEQYSDFEKPEEATEAGAGAGVGAAVGGAAGLLTGLGLMAIPGLGPVLRSVGLPPQRWVLWLAVLRAALWDLSSTAVFRRNMPMSIPRPCAVAEHWFRYKPKIIMSSWYTPYSTHLSRLIQFRRA